MKLVYVASPYSHDDFKVREERYQKVFKFVAETTAISKTFLYYSPILYFHTSAKNYNLPTDSQFWWNNNKLMLDKADEIVILMLDGWDKSVGVALERGYACAKGIPLSFVK